MAQEYAPAKEEEATDATDTPEEQEPGVTDEEIQRIIAQEVADAIEYQRSEIAPRRAEATKRYRGDLYGDEEEGRSKAMSRDFRDTVKAMLPSLVRMFLGSERPVEFMPRGPGDEKIAKQRTDCVNYVAMVDNPGFTILYGGLKDALVRDFVVLKWWHDERTVVENEKYSGLTAAQVKELANKPDVTDVAYEMDGKSTDGLPEDELGSDSESVGPDQTQQGTLSESQPDAPTTPTEPKVYTVHVRRERKEGRARFMTVPGEEFFVSRDATSLEDAKIISHIREVTRSDLIAMGYSEKFIEDHEGSGAFQFKLNPEYIERRPTLAERRGPEVNEDMKLVTYGEHLIRVDRDGDRIAELTQVCTIGDNWFVADIEDAPEVNYCIGCPDPEPNELIGNGVRIDTEDIGRIKTSILRASLDSLRTAIEPATVVLDGEVMMEDVLSPALDRVIRETTPGAVRQLETTFVGQAGLSMLGYMDEVKEQRSGITKGSQGMNADVLQSTTAMAVAAQFSASQQRIELVARVLAETMFKPLFMGLQSLLMRHQDIKRTVRLRGEWVEFDPSTWDAPMDVVVNVGLGTGLPEERLARLEKIYAAQKEILQTIGPSPLVDFNKLRYTLARGTEMAGWNDATAFFGDIPEGWTPPPSAEKPDPATILAQAQAEETRAKVKIEQDKVQEQRLKTMLETETARMKIELEMQLKVYELEIKAGRDIDESRIRAAIEHARIQTDGVLRAFEAEKDHSARVDEANLAAQAASSSQGAA